MIYDQEKDFIDITLKILVQYEEYLKIKRKPEWEKYEETLFVNCLIGLLVIIDKEYLKYYPENKTPKLSITNIEDQEFPVNQDLIRKLRNSLNHGNAATGEKVRLRDRDGDKKIDTIYFPHDGIGDVCLSKFKLTFVEIARRIYDCIPN